MFEVDCCRKKNIRLTDSYQLQRDATDRQGSHYQSKPVCYRREKLRRQHAGRKHEIAAFGISFSPARLHLASPVIGARVSETLVSRRQTICEYRPAKP